MQIYIVSRFNIYIEKFRKLAGLDDENFGEWCRKRVDLFERYTLPTVLSQSHRHFRWIIGFDTNPTPDVIDLLVKLKQHSFIYPVIHDNRFRIGGNSFQQVVSDIIMSRSNGDNILTSRLDTDDALHRDFVATIHTGGRAAENRGLVPCAINVPYGVQAVDGKLYARVYGSNPFISYLEAPDPNKPLLTAIGPPHYEMEKHAPVREVHTAQPMWTQVVHGGNAANHLPAGLQEILPSPDLLEAMPVLSRE